MLMHANEKTSIPRHGNWNLNVWCWNSIPLYNRGFACWINRGCATFSETGPSSTDREVLLMEISKQTENIDLNMTSACRGMP